MKRMSMSRASQPEHTPSASAFNTVSSIMRADVRRTSALCFVALPLLGVYISALIVRLWRSLFPALRACPVH